mmetsp:Transcript_28697/g.48887  ORF Transcript_28697/g.48887 Transcript_28697/m.48887 type:complete len:81 (-) Transcript_28697:1593-1835(-)
MKIISPINEIKQILNLINVHNYHCLEKIKNVAEQWWSAPGMPLVQRPSDHQWNTPSELHHYYDDFFPYEEGILLSLLLIK